MFKKFISLAVNLVRLKFVNPNQTRFNIHLSTLQSVCSLIEETLVKQFYPKYIAFISVNQEKIQVRRQ